ncbi:hypothetical protein JZX87_28990 [Agrobacterium sp. Ap1]|nr:hypothetical protein [Agrobacterium sp. Ap1]
MRYFEDVTDFMLSARELPSSDVEALTIRAIQTNRRLMKPAESLFQALPEEYQTGDLAAATSILHTSKLNSKCSRSPIR